MELVFIAVAAFLVSGLTLFSGFGLGTLLLPVFALFLPVEVAVVTTAMVHGANNVMKAAVVGRNAERDLVLKFGLPAVVAAFVGAYLLGTVSTLEPLFAYSIAGRQATVTPLKLVMGILMFCFALFELLPNLRNLKFERKHLFIGGLLSGFFGGLSGHQGALRSAFLVKTGISTESFIGTNAIIGLIVDSARLSIYGLLALKGGLRLYGAHERNMVLIGIVAAFLGVLVGKQYMHKVTISKVQVLTGLMLFAIALALGTGII